MTRILLLAVFLAQWAMVPASGQDSLVWTEQNTNVNYTLWGVHFVDTLHGWAVGDRGTVVRTTDGGQTWMQISFPSGGDSLRAVAFINPERGWTAGSAGQIYESVDSGKTWVSSYTSTLDFITDGVFINDQVGFFTGSESFEGAILRTGDGGQTWSQTLINNSTSINSICFPIDSTGWAAGQDDITRTGNMGATWSDATTPASSSYRSYVNTIWFTTASIGFGSGRYGGLSSTSGGAWTLFDTTLSDWIEDIHFPDSLRGVMVGERGLIRWTQNGGSIWTATHPRHPSSLNAPWFRSVLFTDPDHGWVVGDSGIIMKGAFVPQVISVKPTANYRRPDIKTVIGPALIEFFSVDPAISIAKVELFTTQGKRVQKAESRPDHSTGAMLVSRPKVKGVYLAHVLFSNGRRSIRTLAEMR